MTFKSNKWTRWGKVRCTKQLDSHLQCATDHQNTIYSLLSPAILLWILRPDAVRALRNIGEDGCPIYTGLKLYKDTAWKAEAVISLAVISQSIFLTDYQQELWFSDFKMATLKDNWRTTSDRAATRSKYFGGASRWGEIESESIHWCVLWG